MKLLCGIIMGDVKTGEGTRTALQLTCCMENEGAMICCSSVYLCGAHNEELRHEVKQRRPCVCVCVVYLNRTHMVWEMPMLHWEGCEVTLLVGTSVCIGWLRSMLQEIQSVTERTLLHCTVKNKPKKTCSLFLSGLSP